MRHQVLPIEPYPLRIDRIVTPEGCTTPLILISRCGLPEILEARIGPAVYVTHIRGQLTHFRVEDFRGVNGFFAATCRTCSKDEAPPRFASGMASVKSPPRRFAGPVASRRGAGEERLD